MREIELPATRTHASRCCCWTQVHAGLGLLLVKEGKTCTTRKPTGHYLVEEQQPEYCRRFKLTKEGGTEVYWCGIAERPEDDMCDCTGFESHGLCKHVDALRATIYADVMVDRNAGPVTCFSEDLDYLIGDIN